MYRNIVKTIMVTVVITTIMSATVLADTLTTGVFKRLSGTTNTATATAIAISKEKNQTDGTIIIANDTEFADALAGSSLGYQENKATVLLTNKDSMDADTAAEIQARKPSKIIILGGTAAVSEYTEAVLKSICINTIRLSGSDRYRTAILIGGQIEVITKSDTVFLAYGDDYPDALAASTFAAINGSPILFTGTATLNLDSATALTKWGIKKVVILGGTGVISTNVETQVTSLGINATRLGGVNRHETAKLIVDKYYDTTKFSGLTICSGDDFQGALLGVSIATEKNAPVMLYGSSISEDIKSYIKGKNDRGYTIEGTDIISDAQMISLQK